MDKPPIRVVFLLFMRLSYTDLQEQFLRNINLVGSTNTSLLADFDLHLGQRYQLALAKLKDFKTEIYEAPFLVGMNVILLSSGVSQTISSITSSSTTATVTTAAAHGYTTSNSVAISGAFPAAYNGTYTITVTGTTTFTYTLSAAQVITTALVSQYYPYPVSSVSIEGMYITVGSVKFPLLLEPDLYSWEKLNAIMIQASALPQFYFSRRDDFGIWPIPQTTYTGYISYHYRDRDLSVADYTSGTVTVTSGSTTITGSSTTFTAAMVGRWITITDTATPGQGYWYRVTAYTDATHISIYQPWSAATAAGVSYRIGETPELPEEIHSSLVDGATADYYSGMRKDLTTAALFENKFWSGSPSNTTRKIGTGDQLGGIIGAMNTYSNRDDSRIVDKNPKLNPLSQKIWATRLSLT